MTKGKPKGRGKKLRPINKQRAFLAAYRELGNIKSAAIAAGCDRSHVYQWRRDDPEFVTAMAEAAEEAIETLEAEARRRAVEGTVRPVFHQGHECGGVREYSDTLLIFLLKGAKPDKYRDNHAVNVSGQIDATVNLNYARRAPSPAEVRERVVAAANRLGVVSVPPSSAAPSHSNGTNGHTNGHH